MCFIIIIKLSVIALRRSAGRIGPRRSPQRAGAALLAETTGRRGAEVNPHVLARLEARHLGLPHPRRRHSLPGPEGQAEQGGRPLRLAELAGLARVSEPPGAHRGHPDDDAARGPLGAGAALEHLPAQVAVLLHHRRLRLGSKRCRLALAGPKALAQTCAAEAVAGAADAPGAGAPPGRRGAGSGGSGPGASKLEQGGRAARGRGPMVQAAPRAALRRWHGGSASQKGRPTETTGFPAASVLISGLAPGLAHRVALRVALRQQGLLGHCFHRRAQRPRPRQPTGAHGIRPGV
mmetsp:Transcript_50844/g.115471  ORF Transcript_50844/g.115471 Transcript_50844/m.115471 type:complete len:292 (+) Transcript_50844:316-1191(+)